VGNHRIVWDASNEKGVQVSSRIYFYYFKANDSASGTDFNKTLKMVSMK